MGPLIDASAVETYRSVVARVPAEGDVTWTRADGMKHAEVRSLLASAADRVVASVDELRVAVGELADQLARGPAADHRDRRAPAPDIQRADAEIGISACRDRSKVKLPSGAETARSNATCRAAGKSDRRTPAGPAMRRMSTRDAPACFSMLVSDSWMTR